MTQIEQLEQAIEVLESAYFQFIEEADAYNTVRDAAKQHLDTLKKGTMTNDDEINKLTGPMMPGLSNAALGPKDEQPTPSRGEVNTKINYSDVYGKSNPQKPEVIETPRTNKAKKLLKFPTCFDSHGQLTRDEYWVPFNEAEQLERELITVREQLATVTKERDAWKANSESWESTAKLDSRLPCGHPDACGYDKNNDGRWANIGCRMCELKEQLAAVEKERDEALYMRNLLAILHCDGGHYTTEHGIRKSTDDAINIVVEIKQDRDQLLSDAREFFKALEHVDGILNACNWSGAKQVVKEALLTPTAIRILNENKEGKL